MKREGGDDDEKGRLLYYNSAYDSTRQRYRYKYFEHHILRIICCLLYTMHINGSGSIVEYGKFYGTAEPTQDMYICTCASGRRRWRVVFSLLSVYHCISSLQGTGLM